MKTGSNLKGCFSEENLKRLESVREHIRPRLIGDVYSMLLDERDEIIVPPGEIYHPKMVIVVGYNIDSNEYVGSTLINSKINENIFYTEELRADHHPLFRKDYDFILDGHDPSYVNCAEIKAFSKERVLSEKYLGSLLEHDFQQVIQLIEHSRQISPKIKKKYGFEEKAK